MVGGLIAGSAIAWMVSSASAYAEVDDEVHGHVRGTVEKVVEPLRHASDRAVDHIRERAKGSVEGVPQAPAQEEPPPEEPPPVALPEPEEPEHADAEPAEELTEKVDDTVETVRGLSEDTMRGVRDVLGSVVIDPYQPGIPERCTPWHWRWCYWQLPVDINPEPPVFEPGGPTAPDAPDVSNGTSVASELAESSNSPGPITVTEPSVASTTEQLMRSGRGSHGQPTIAASPSAVDTADGRTPSPERGSGAAPSAHADTTPLAVTPRMPMASTGDAATAVTRPMRAFGRPGAQPGVTPD